MRTPPLDDLDHAILDRLQRDSRTIAESIAADVGLSAAAVQRRIKRLRESGVIAREVAVLNPKALGQAMTFVVEVEMERERSEVLDAFRYQVDADPNVQQCYYVTGAYDFVLIVIARDMEDFEEFTQRTFFDNANVRRFTTSIVMRPVKVGLTLPLPTKRT
ncbi:Lrp/AsnC family transcriptional regulator [Nonomuraea sp. NPDC049152]|uniref:Lrp/AsnC family transcriptional regulator n=1 Tax=Nonomuraea sp. NPDC049152 TaxID=3154350 RepID=UPI0033F5A6C0